MNSHLNWCRALRPDRWQLESLSVACVVGASLTVSHLLKAFGDLRPQPVDFVIFHQSVRRWLTDGVLYDPSGTFINYNAPHFHLLLVPLGFIPLPAAFLIWTCVSLVTAAATVVITVRECSANWTPTQVRAFFAAVLLCAGTGVVVHLGQVGWFIAYLITLAWRAARHSRWPVAGFWLGCAAALKPFLLVFIPVFIVRRRWRALLLASLTIGMWMVAGVMVFGLDATRDWVNLLRAGAPSAQMSYFINASAAAIVARGGGAKLLGDVTGAVIVAVSVWATRSTSEDATWLIVLTSAILASPLGWIYYAPLLTAPLAAAAADGELPGTTWRIWPLLAIPAISRDLFEGTVMLAVSLGSAYSWGLLVLWAAAVRSSLSGRSVPVVSYTS